MAVLTRAHVAFVAFIIFCCVNSHDVEHCKYVTIPVCGDQEVTTSLTSGIQGQERGPTGSPGKMGPRGPRGMKGDVGTPGTDGQNADPLQIERIVNDKVQEMKMNLVAMSGVDFCNETREAGIYLVHGQQFVCDGQGWTVIQHRRDGSVDFERNWVEYKNGFGSLDGEFWFGLDAIHKVMRGRNCQLRVELGSFDGKHAHAQYSSFLVDDEEKKYRLSISGYKGTAGDSMSFHDGMMFTTKDRDNDLHASNCAASNGGWWFKNCY